MNSHTTLHYPKGEAKNEFDTALRYLKGYYLKLLVAVYKPPP